MENMKNLLKCSLFCMYMIILCHYCCMCQDTVDISKILNEVMELRSAVKILQKQVQELQSKNEDLEEKAHTHPLVAFFATANIHRSYNNGDRVIFDQVLRNEGGHYLSSNSSFTCPTDGLYMFSVSVLSYIGKYVYMSLIHEGMNLALAYGHSAHHHQGSATMMIKCLQGERVWAESQGDNRRVWGSSANYNFFTGALINNI